MSDPSAVERDTYRVAFRDDDEGYLDDVVVKNVAMFRLERMSDGSFWAACYLDENADERVVFQITGGRRSKSQPMPCMVYVTEYPQGVEYECYRDSRHVR